MGFMRHPRALRAAFAAVLLLSCLPATPSAQVTGTGLGLFIVRSVIRRHGGRVFASSEGSGTGATFTVQLPRPTA